MMLPHLTTAPIISEYSVQLNCLLQKELFWFQGHFPVQAIFPGVAQIDLVMHYAQTYLKCPVSSFSGLEVVKFKQPLFPNELVELTIEWLEEQHKLKFHYCCHGITASSGQINL